MLYPYPPPPQKHSIVRAQHSIASVMHYFSVVGRSRSKDLLIGRLTILVLLLVLAPVDWQYWYHYKMVLDGRCFSLSEQNVKDK